MTPPAQADAANHAWPVIAPRLERRGRIAQVVQREPLIDVLCDSRGRGIARSRSWARNAIERKKLRGVHSNICHLGIISRLRSLPTTKQYCARTSFFHSGAH
jgi:hypothetical protein